MAGVGEFSVKLDGIGERAGVGEIEGTEVEGIGECEVDGDV